MKKLTDKLKNNKFFQNKKNIKILIFIAILSAITLVGYSLAYFYSRGYLPNSFVTAAYDVKIEENFAGTWGTKEVKFVNNGSTPVVLRVSYIEIMNNLKKQLILNNRYRGIDVVKKGWTNDWIYNFVDGGDGWYYFKKVLKGKDEVQVLNSIKFNSGLFAEDSEDYIDYLESEYELTFNYEVTQSSQKSIKELWGIDATVNGDDIEWGF